MANEAVYKLRGKYSEERGARLKSWESDRRGYGFLRKLFLKGGENEGNGGG